MRPRIVRFTKRFTEPAFLTRRHVYFKREKQLAISIRCRHAIPDHAEIHSFPRNKKHRVTFLSRNIRNT